MASTLQLTCLILLICITHSWSVPSSFDEHLPSDHLHDSINTNSTYASVFDDMNKIMAMMHKRFQRMFAFSSFPTDYNDNDRKQFAAIEPVCTTSTNSPTIISMEKNRRKKLRNTQTTTCVKELIIGGKKQLYQEMNVTDEKGILISQSKSYQTIFINTNNNTTPRNMMGDKNVITY